MEARPIELTQTILNHVRDYIILTNTSSKIIYFNKAVHRLGYSREELFRKSISQLAYIMEIPRRATTNEKVEQIGILFPKDETQLLATFVMHPITHNQQNLFCYVIKELEDTRSLERQLLHVLLQNLDLKTKLIYKKGPLAPFLPEAPTSKPHHYPTLDQVVKEFILVTLHLTGWKVSGPSGAAELLDINPKTLESKMAKLNIRRIDYSP